MILKKKVLLLCIFFLIFSSFPIFSAINIENFETNISSEIIVDDEGDGDFTNIQQAIDHAGNDDIISVYSGTYNEHIKINKKITIQGISCEFGVGNDSGFPIIDGGGRKDVVVIDAEGCEFTGFKVVDSALKYSMGYGIKILSDDCRVVGNIVKNCFVGINANNVSNCDVAGNVFYYNVFGLNVGKISNCKLSNNSFFNSGLTVVSEAKNFKENIFSNNTVNNKPVLLYIQKNNTVISNPDIGQLILLDCHNITLEKLNINNTTIGVMISESSNLTIRNCVFSDIHRGGISLHGENSEIHNVSFKNCSYGCYIEGGRGFYLHHNNFIEVYKHDQPVFSWVKKHQTFMESKNIVFDSNYYSDWIGLKFSFMNWFPKIIPGFRTYTHKWLNIFPVFKFDFHPQQNPYNITV